GSKTSTRTGSARYSRRLPRCSPPDLGVPHTLLPFPHTSGVDMSASPSASKRPRPLQLLIEIPAIVVLFVMMIHVTANALTRAFASSPIPNTLEITQYIYVPIIALLGFMAAQSRGEHIVADLVAQYFPKRVRRVVLAGGYLLGVVVFLGFAWF